jgi:uncharacterized protein with HEPN domain
MVDAIREALSFVRGKERSELDSNRMLALALVQLLEVIGEAASGISDEFRDAHSPIPWKSIIGMRHRLIHGYFDVDLDIVWQTVHTDLPPLLRQLDGLVSKFKP